MNIRTSVADMLLRLSLASDAHAVSGLIRSAVLDVQEAGAGRPAAFPYLDPPKRQRGDAAGDVEGLFQSSISDAERENMAKRSGPGKVICVDFTEDALDQGFKVLDGPDKDTAKDLSDEFLPPYKDLIRDKLLEALVYTQIYGFSALLATHTRTGDYAAKLPTKPGKLLSYDAIPKTWVKSITQKKDAQGRVKIPRTLEGYQMNDQLCSIPKIQASHFEHIRRRSPISGSYYEGESALDAAFDGLTVWKHILWGLGQTFWRNGSRLLSITGPAEAEEWQLDRIDEALQNLSTKTAFAVPYGSKVDSHGTDALNPKAYEEAALDEVSSASRIPRNVLMGIQKGAVAGSETDRKLYSSAIASFQSSVVQAPLEKALQRLQRTGQIAFKGDFFILWTGPETQTEKEMADTRLLNARAHYYEGATPRDKPPPIPRR